MSRPALIFSKVVAMRRWNGLGAPFGLRGYTRARCHSSLTFLVTMEIIHIKKIEEGELQKALV
jgi:hypothetical protein